MEITQRLCPNASEVAAKVIDGEAIIIRLSDGLYFSMNYSGSLIWELIERRMTLEEIVAFVGAHYNAPEVRVRDDVMGLAAQLLRENLVTTSNDSVSVTSADNSPKDHKDGYETPQLVQYQDMAELLALDPPAPGLADVVWQDPAEE